MWVSCTWFFGILSLFQPQPRTLYNGAACPSLLRASFQGVSCVPKAFVLSCSFDKILGSEDLAHSISLSHSPPGVLVIGTSHFSEEALPQGLVLHPNLAHWARLDTAPQQRTSSICCPKATSMTAPKTGLPSKRSLAACWTAHAHSETQTPTHTHTHLLRNILSNYWCGMHRTCKNTPVNPDRRNWLSRRERQCEENLSLPLQKESNCSDAARSSSINGGISDTNKW